MYKIPATYDWEEVNDFGTWTWLGEMEGERERGWDRVERETICERDDTEQASSTVTPDPFHPLILIPLSLFRSGKET